MLSDLSSSLRPKEPQIELDFTARACLSEWMDEPCTYEEFRACLRDLAVVNRVTLAYRPTRLWLERLLAPVTGGEVQITDARPLHIVDVGSGQGDMLRYLARWAKDASIPVRLTGIDLNPFAARAASSIPHVGPSIEWLTTEAYAYASAAGIDVVISSLFTHHLPDDEIVRFLAWMERVASRGWFINDLHRNKAPYHLFRLLARAAQWHPFVQHDGPVSIRRSFRKQDWLNYLGEAGVDVSAISIETFRPSRLCVGRIR